MNKNELIEAVALKMEDNKKVSDGTLWEVETAR